MSRYINGEELINRYKQIISDYAENGMYPSGFGIEDAMKMTADMPSEITMCKDCQHFKLKGNDPLIGKRFGRCDRTADFWYEGEEVYEDDYCSWGKGVKK